MCNIMGFIAARRVYHEELVRYWRKITKPVRPPKRPPKRIEEIEWDI